MEDPQLWSWRIILWLTLMAVLWLVILLREMHQKDDKRKRHISNLVSLIDKMSRELDRRGGANLLGSRR